jgi:predicted nucleic acid-binding protein
LILVDTSAWVEYLRGTQSSVHQALRELIVRGKPLATTEVVVMEVLAGARDQGHLERLRRLLLRCQLLPARGVADYEQAAALFRQCRLKGETIRRLTDCLIATIAIRDGVEVLHADTDFQAIARHTALRVTPGETA